jgi:hypothetical protein
MSVTFPVSTVKKASKPLPFQATTAFDLIESQLKVRPEAAGSNLNNLLPNGMTFRGKVYPDKAMHGFLRATTEAFKGHYPLILSPDNVWLCIAQGFAAHVNVHAEKLRKQFVQHEGKIELEIERHGFRKGAHDNDWQGAFKEFSDKISEHIGKKRDLLVCDFSTTGPVEKAASELVLMDTLKSYFDFSVLTLCGIPEITLLGERSDWESILERAQVLAEYGCEEWIRSLTSVLKTFVEAFDGKADPKIWESFYKYEDESGGPNITGFINAFFPYLIEDQPNDYALGWDQKRVQEREGGPTTQAFPSGLSVVPFKWKYYEEELPMQFVGGFVGAHHAWDSWTFAIQPAIGWGVADRKDK